MAAVVLAAGARRTQRLFVSAPPSEPCQQWACFHMGVRVAVTALARMAIIGLA